MVDSRVFFDVNPLNVSRYDHLFALIPNCLWPRVEIVKRPAFLFGNNLFLKSNRGGGVEPFWENEDFESKLKEGVLLQKGSKIVYRIVLVVCGIILFLLGWIMWNIPLESEDGTTSSLLVNMNKAVGYDLGGILFLGGLFIQLIIAPYFVLSALFNRGRLSWFVPKEIREYLALKREIEARSPGARNPDKEIEDLYWEALRDPNHRYHNDIVRYKWMDKIKWKHRPSDFFGHAIYTGMEETTLGEVVPKTSDAYRNSNVTFDENNNVNGIANPAIHPLQRIIPDSLALLFIALVTAVGGALDMAQSGASSILKAENLLVPLLWLFFAWIFVKRNTDLLPSRKRKQNPNDFLSDEALREKLDLLRTKFVSVREHEEEKKAIEARYLERHDASKNNLSITTLILVLVSVATIWVGLDSNSLDNTLTLWFSLFAISLLAAKHFRLELFALSFKGYRLTQDYLYLLDGIYSKKLKRNEIPEHSCIRIVDLYPTNSVKYHSGPNVCLHLIRLVREEPDFFAKLGQTLVKPGYRLNGYERIFFDGVGPGNEGIECWVEDIKIRFEFKTKAEQREFAEKLANELSLPIREHWRWSDDKKSNLFWLGSDWSSIPENKRKGER